MTINRISGEFDARRNVAKNAGTDSNEFFELLQEHMGDDVDSVPLSEGVNQSMGVGSLSKPFPVHALNFDPQTFVNKDQILDVNAKINDAFSKL